MGWQGVDLKIRTRDTYLFCYEADPDDTCVCKEKSKEILIDANFFTLELQHESDFNIEIVIRRLNTLYMWVINDIDFPYCPALMASDFEKSQSSSLYFTSPKADWRISVTIEYNGKCYFCAQSDHSICSGCANTNDESICSICACSDCWCIGPESCEFSDAEK